MHELLFSDVEHFVELFGLGYCAGEAVEDKAVRGGSVSYASM
jgi:hypothetical protein